MTEPAVQLAAPETGAISAVRADHPGVLALPGRLVAGERARAEGRLSADGLAALQDLAVLESLDDQRRAAWTCSATGSSAVAAPSRTALRPPAGPPPRRPSYARRLPERTRSPYQAPRRWRSATCCDTSLPGCSRADPAGAERRDRRRGRGARPHRDALHPTQRRPLLPVLRPVYPGHLAGVAHRAPAPAGARRRGRHRRGGATPPRPGPGRGQAVPDGSRCAGGHPSRPGLRPLTAAILGSLSYDRLLAPIDVDHPGGVDWLRAVPSGRSVALGLVGAARKPVPAYGPLMRVIDAAARISPGDDLAVSTVTRTACGDERSPLSQQVEQRALNLVVRLARANWPAVPVRP